MAEDFIVKAINLALQITGRVPKWLEVPHTLQRRGICDMGIHKNLIIAIVLALREARSPSL